jgi:hypothetical protein
MSSRSMRLKVNQNMRLTTVTPTPASGLLVSGRSGGGGSALVDVREGCAVED